MILLYTAASLHKNKQLKEYNGAKLTSYPPKRQWNSGNYTI